MCMILVEPFHMRIEKMLVISIFWSSFLLACNLQQFLFEVNSDTKLKCQEWQKGIYLESVFPIFHIT